jgi:hypothetical protein
LFNQLIIYETGFRARSHDEQLKYAQEYAECLTQTARDEFVKNFATRWFELARLPYFDVCRMIIIDPMHNLLLGEHISSSERFCLLIRVRSCQDSLLSYLDSTQDPSQDQGAPSFPRHPFPGQSFYFRAILYVSDIILATDSYISWANSIAYGSACWRLTHG